MSRDPAFLFYSSDFLTGIQDLTMEERGQYITLLCVQHQKGRLSRKAVAIAVPNAAADVIKKFKEDENGLLYNERLEIEAIKRAEHAEKQRQRALSGWDKRRKKDDAAANAVGMPLENVNENEIKKDKYGDFVLMTKDEYNKLISIHGNKNTNVFIEILNNYKGSKGKKYKSDYRAILSWVIDKAKKEGKYKIYNYVNPDTVYE